MAALGLLMFYYIVYTENTYDHAFAHRSEIIPVCIALMLFAGLKIVKTIFVIY